MLLCHTQFCTRFSKLDIELTLDMWFPDYPCLAEYSDGKYYRAQLMKFSSVEPVMIMVKHVDFGSDDTLPTSKYED